MRKKNLIVANIRRGKSNTICALNFAPGLSFMGSANYFLGKYNATPTEDYLYLLPAKNGAKIRIEDSISVLYAMEKIDKQMDEYKGLLFPFLDSDTICAARSGLVVSNEAPRRKRTGYQNSANCLALCNDLYSFSTPCSFT